MNWVVLGIFELLLCFVHNIRNQTNLESNQEMGSTLYFRFVLQIITADPMHNVRKRSDFID